MGGGSGGLRGLLGEMFIVSFYIALIFRAMRKMVS